MEQAKQKRNCLAVAQLARIAPLCHLPAIGTFSGSVFSPGHSSLQLMLICLSPASLWPKSSASCEV